MLKKTVRLLLAITVILLLFQIGVNLQHLKLNADLLSAVEQNNLQRIRSLLSAGANPDVQAQDGTPVLQRAWESKHLDAAFALLKAGAKPVYVPQLLDAAASQGDTALLNFLIKKGSDLNKDMAGKRALQSATTVGQVESVRLLLVTGVNPNTRDSRGNTPLLNANMNESEIIQLLLKYGANPNARDRQNGWTPLYYALANGSQESVALLIKHGADVHIKDKNGVTPLQYASQLLQYASHIDQEHAANTRTKIKQLRQASTQY